MCINRPLPAGEEQICTNRPHGHTGRPNPAGEEHTASTGRPVRWDVRGPRSKFASTGRYRQARSTYASTGRSVIWNVRGARSTLASTGRSGRGARSKIASTGRNQQARSTYAATPGRESFECSCVNPGTTETESASSPGTGGKVDDRSEPSTFFAVPICALFRGSHPNSFSRFPSEQFFAVLI